MLTFCALLFLSLMRCCCSLADLLREYFTPLLTRLCTAQNLLLQRCKAQMSSFFHTFEQIRKKGEMAGVYQVCHIQVKHRGGRGAREEMISHLWHNQGLTAAVLKGLRAVLPSLASALCFPGDASPLGSWSSSAGCAAFVAVPGGRSVPPARLLVKTPCRVWNWLIMIAVARYMRASPK